jgi:flagellar basal-body rod modification protein FlgD
MSSNVVNSASTSYKVYEPTNNTKKASSELNKDTFLKLLVTQMQNQDPLNPMEDREFISQMAQFSSLEQMQQLNTSMTASQTSIMDHIKQMNNNLVKSQTNIIKMLEVINETLGGELLSAKKDEL